MSIEEKIAQHGLDGVVLECAIDVLLLQNADGLMPNERARLGEAYFLVRQVHDDCLRRAKTIQQAAE
jgi:hypothetical protein